MERIRNSLYRFMIGRYGYDELGKVLIYSSLILCVLNIFIGNAILNALIWVLLIYGTFRAFSKNIYARRNENDKFLYWIKPWQMKWKYKGTHKVFRCKSCGQILRVPKGKGQIEITCPKCRNVISKRT